MACRSCGSENLVTLRGELTITCATLEGAKRPPLYVCQTLLACPNCGFAELKIPPVQLQALVRNSSSASQH